MKPAQVSGRLEPAKVVEREENKYDQQAFAGVSGMNLCMAF